MLDYVRVIVWVFGRVFGRVFTWGRLLKVWG